MEPEELSALLVTGTGGQGKTRLAAELAVTIATQGWLTGFLASSATVGDIEEMLAREGRKLTWSTTRMRARSR